MNTNELAKILHANCFGEEVEFENFSIDTRTLKPGEVYFAIRGHSLDGHDYIAQAKAQGAVAAVVDHQVDMDIPQLVVTDTTIALGEYAAYLRSQFDIPVVAITGSLGKTTTRNMLAAICKTAYGNEHVLVPKKNYNNQWGLPLTLRELNQHHHCAILEMGMDGLGEIAKLSKIAKPSIAAITCAAPMHIGELGSMDNIAKAKGEIFSNLSSDGVAILNKDDKYVDFWCELLNGQRIISFAENNDADIKGEVIAPQTFNIHLAKESFVVELNLLGQHNITNVLTAVAAASAMNIPVSAMVKGLESLQPEAGRLEIKQAFNGARIIDDTYNAGPDSMRAALKVLAEYHGHKIFVMGDMGQLEPNEVALHEGIAEDISAAGVDLFLSYGELTQYTQKRFSGQGEHFSSHDALGEYLKSQLLPESTVLIKASRFMTMEKVVNYLL